MWLASGGPFLGMAAAVLASSAFSALLAVKFLQNVDAEVADRALMAGEH
jgi:hypothetical protein